MAQDYQLVELQPGQTVKLVLRVADQAMIPFDPENMDYQRFLAWVAEGNAPDPAPAKAQAKKG